MDPLCIAIHILLWLRIVGWWWEGRCQLKTISDRKHCNYKHRFNGHQTTLLHSLPIQCTIMCSCGALVQAPPIVKTAIQSSSSDRSFAWKWILHGWVFVIWPQHAPNTAARSVSLLSAPQAKHPHLTLWLQFNGVIIIAYICNSLPMNTHSSTSYFQVLQSARIPH